MVRPLRIEFPGAVYHVTSRGDRREPIVVDDFDRVQFFTVLTQAFERFDVDAFAYCLMSNHYHIVIRTHQGNLSRLMRHINGVYTQSFNRRHGLAGHLFQGRFKAILVDTDSYLLEVCRYVDLNPVRARMVNTPQEHVWSSYKALAGLEKAPQWLDTATVHAQLSPNSGERKAARQYAQFVSEGHGVQLWADALKQQIYLGDDSFIHKMQSHASSPALKQRPANLSKIQSTKPPLERSISYYVSQAQAATSKLERNNAIANAFYKGGYTQTAIAAAMDLSGSTVSRVIQAAERGEL